MFGKPLMDMNMIIHLENKIKKQTNKHNCTHLDLTIEASFGSAQDLKWCCISSNKETIEK